MPRVSDAGLTSIPRLKKRRDFLRAARGFSAARPGFVLQARRRTADEPVLGPRLGFTASKKVGGAVVRNRAKRRLRAAADQVLPQLARPDHDYVLIARADGTVSTAFDALLSDLASAVAQIHDGRGRKGEPRRRR